METAELREATQAMVPHADFDVVMTFYYDETNNVRVLHIKKGDFNADFSANFVLGGFAYVGTKPDLADIFNGIQLQPNVIEVKLAHLAKGSFDECLKEQKVNTFLVNISAKPLYLHISTLNLLYYSVVDIVDSVLPDELVRYAPAFKNAIYIACKNHLPAIIPLFVKYSYPNVSHELLEDFVDELMKIIEPSKADRQNRPALEKLDSLLREAAKLDSLHFITDEEDHVLIKDLMPLYGRLIYLFINSTHIFDEEVKIKESLENFSMLNNGNKISNYSFLNSKADKLIQSSDVIIGLFGKLFKYINGKSHAEIEHDVTKMSKLQLENLDLLLGLMEKSIAYNPAFLHYVDAIEETSKISLIGKLRGKNI